ncbi:heme-binding protein [Patescibacteria group bacterium]|nr:heme-binding protein [Patescibacteria group bacterium]
MLNLSKSKEALELSEKKAKELGIKVTTVVVDEHGTLVAMSRMDGAFYISPKFASMKAYTSALLGLPSGDIAPYTEEGKPYFGLNAAFSNELITLAGGLPIKDGDKVVGGVGVGGSLDVNDDVKCAEEALKAFGKTEVKSVA